MKSYTYLPTKSGGNRQRLHTRDDLVEDRVEDVEVRDANVKFAECPGKLLSDLAGDGDDFCFVRRASVLNTQQSTAHVPPRRQPR